MKNTKNTIVFGSSVILSLSINVFASGGNDCG